MTAAVQVAPSGDDAAFRSPVSEPASPALPPTRRNPEPTGSAEAASIMSKAPVFGTAVHATPSGEVQTPPTVSAVRPTATYPPVPCVTPDIQVPAAPGTSATAL